MKKHNIFVIYSKQSEEDIRAFLNSYTDKSEDIGLIRSDHIKDDKGLNRETNRRLITLTDDIYRELKKDGYTENTKFDFKIKTYEIRDNNNPPEDCSYVLYIKFPSVLKGQIEYIKNKIEYLKKIGFIESDEYKIYYPNNNYCLISFPQLNNKKKIITFKILLDQQTYENHVIRCSWAKTQILNELISKYEMN